MTLADQACGSGHILLYAFELLTRIYEESGYAKSEIPGLILAHNLTGFEIDERAAQLAAFTLMMRARRYHRSSLRKGLAPNIVRFQDLALSPEQSTQTLTEHGITASKELRHDLTLMQQATNFGSLITPTASTEEIIRARTQVQSKLEGADLFAANALRQLDVALHQLAELSRKFWCVVDNPPYMGSGNMNPALSKYVKKLYPNSKSDLFSSFMERGLRAVKENGYVGMITMQSWMFLSSYEKLRKLILSEYLISSLVQVGYNSFPELNSKIAQAASFVIQRALPEGKRGIYYNLNDVSQSANKQRVFEKKIDDQEFHHVDQLGFDVVPGSPLGYWVEERMINVFAKGIPLSSIADCRQGFKTGDNNQFLRFWYEVSSDDIKKSKNDIRKWMIVTKGGPFKRWAGNYDYVVEWKDDGYKLRNFYGKNNKLRSRPQNLQYLGREGVTWTSISSGLFSARYFYNYMGFESSGPVCFPHEENDVLFLLGLLNSDVIQEVLNILSPALSYSEGMVGKIPVFRNRELESKIADLSKQRVYYETYSDLFDETSRRFVYTRGGHLGLERTRPHRPSRFGGGYDYKGHEDELNDLVEQLYFGKRRFKKEERIAKEKEDSKNKKHKGIVFPISTQILMSQRNLKQKKSIANFQWVVPNAKFISYAVGCMLGRYSLDKEGLILANAGDTLREYAEKVGKGEAEWTFAPDEDGILPVLAGEYFPDDIVGRFRVFLRAAFGEDHFVENLAFVEECIGKDIRSYFVRDFYKDHVKRYKKRPIYWMFQSPGKHFRALVYLHRYQPDTVGRLLNDYLRPFIDRLTTERDNAQAVKDNAGSTSAAIAQASKTIEYANQALRDCEAYQKDLLELARRRIPLDLDDGVLVNYNKMGDAVETITGVNDAKGRKKVRGFDWVEWEWGE